MATDETRSYGRRAADALDAARVIDQTLEILMASSTDPGAREIMLELQSKVQTHREKLLNKLGDIYSEIYSAEELRAFLDFHDSPAGRAMRAKQSEVEERIRAATTDFLQDMIAGKS